MSAYTDRNGRRSSWTTSALRPKTSRSAPTVERTLSSNRNTPQEILLTGSRWIVPTPRRIHLEQDRNREAWTSIQLSYCLERYRQGDTPRCPVDDSYIVCTEFTDDTVEFRCPYCNRSGRARTGRGAPAPEA